MSSISGIASSITNLGVFPFGLLVLGHPSPSVIIVMKLPPQTLGQNALELVRIIFSFLFKGLCVRQIDL